MVVASQRFSNASNPCPICGGHERQKRGTGQRCNGFLSDDGLYAHCSREEYAGAIRLTRGSETYAHRMRGPCNCGEQHGEAVLIQRKPDRVSKRTGPGGQPITYRDFAVAVDRP